MVAIAIKTVSQRVEEILRSHGFTRISYFSKRTPEQKTDKYRADIREFEQWIEDKKNELVSMADDRDKLRLLADYYRIRADKYKVWKYSPIKEHICHIGICAGERRRQGSGCTQ